MVDYPKLRIEIQLVNGILEISGDLDNIKEHMQEIIKITEVLNQKLPTPERILRQRIPIKQKQDIALGGKSSEEEYIGGYQRDYSKMSLRQRIEALLVEGVFDKPISAQDVRLELESRGVYHETRRIASELTRSFVRRNQIRRLGSRGKFSYVKA